MKGCRFCAALDWFHWHINVRKTFMTILPSQLADLLQLRKEELVESWMRAVRSDPRIHTDDELHEIELRNHVPDIILEVAAFIREGENPSAGNTREARVHTYTRYRQGYRGRELVCELSLLRMMLLDIVGEELAGRSSDPVEVLIKASRTINLYIDEELRFAISMYTEAVRQTEPLPPV